MRGRDEAKNLRSQKQQQLLLQKHTHAHTVNQSSSQLGHGIQGPITVGKPLKVTTTSRVDLPPRALW